MGAGALTYTTVTNVFAPQVKAVKERRDLMDFFNEKTNKYAVNGNVLGDKDAKLKVYVYTDYNCPFCGAFEIMFHKAVKELKGFEVIHKHLPLDMECNKFLSSPFHIGSCQMARYAMAAEKQGKFWQMDSTLFEFQPATEDEILEIAKQLELNVDKLKKDANSDSTKKRLEEMIKEAYSEGIDATPSMKIGDKVVVGIRPYSELKQMLEDAGAKSR